jgi:hypothetical protein
VLRQDANILDRSAFCKVANNVTFQILWHQHFSARVTIKPAVSALYHAPIDDARRSNLRTRIRGQFETEYIADEEEKLRIDRFPL